MKRFNADQVSLSEAPQQVRVDYSLIQAHANTQNISTHQSGSSFFIAFEILIDESCAPIDPRIVCPEEIAFEYSKFSRPNHCPSIWATRDEFPKDLPHLNPVPENSYASICLWRDGGNNSLYEHQGARGLIDTLVEWLNDAQDGELQHDGWEPTPRGSNIDCYCRIGELQNLVFSSMKQETQVLYSKSNITLFQYENTQPQGCIFPGHDLTAKKKQKYQKTLSNNTISAQTATVLLCAPSDSEPNTHNPIDIKSGEDFEQYLKYCGIEYSTHKLKQYAKTLLPKKKNKYSSIYLNVLIAHKRPIRLIEDIPDLAEGPAGAIEVIALLIEFEVKNQSSIKIHPCTVTGIGSRSLLNKISGTTGASNSHVVIAGCGAIGSSLSDMLCKQGEKYITLIDNDIFSPHNTARHALGKLNISQSKAHALKSHLEDNYYCNSITAIHQEIDREKLSSPEVQRANLLIDCTASPKVSDEIDIGINSLPVCKCYITHAGKIGIFLYRNKDQSLFDLTLTSYFSALHNEKVSEWLSSRDQPNSRTTSLGVGCGSNTLEMPYSTIQSHNSFFQTLINRKLEGDKESGVFINTLDDDYLPAGHYEIPVPGFTEQNTNGWTITISTEAYKKIERWTEQDTPNEAAGYLMGSFSTTLNRLTVIDATYCAQKKPSRTSATLPAAHDHEETMNTVKLTGNQVFPVGTWHSHPETSPEASPKDKATLSNISRFISERPQPYIMLINGRNHQKTLSMITPEEWN